MATGHHHLTILPRPLLLHLGLHPGMKVGDFGVGGAAFFAKALGQKVGTHGEVLMFDVQKSALSAALSTTRLAGLRNCKAVWCDLEVYEGASGVGQNSLDAGVLINVLNQSKKQPEMLTEIHRLLKPGAKLLVVDWQPSVKVAVGAPPPEDRLAPDRLAAMAQTAGFAPFENFAASPAHWGLVLVKT